MRKRIVVAVCGVVLGAWCLGGAGAQEPDARPPAGGAALRSLAIRCADVAKMEAFFTEAFRGSFRTVDAGGMSCRFGTLPGLTVKLVPLRDKPDFEGYPVHQLGFEVPDVEAAIAIAVKHGGRQEGEIVRRDGTVHGAVRDPDGNSIELYQRSAEPPASPRRPFVVVYAPGPKWLPGKPLREQPLAEHGRYMLSLYRTGKLRDGGPFLDGAGGLSVFLAGDEEEARQLLDADPAVRGGVMTATLHPWHAVDWDAFGRRAAR